MKHIADWALELATQRGASYADARMVDERSRSLATKNGKVGHASDAESQGMGIRVIADGAWGFAASKELSRAEVEATGAGEARKYSACPRKSGYCTVDVSLPHRSVHDLDRTKPRPSPEDRCRA